MLKARLIPLLTVLLLKARLIPLLTALLMPTRLMQPLSLPALYFILLLAAFLTHCLPSVLSCSPLVLLHFSSLPWPLSWLFTPTLALEVFLAPPFLCATCAYLALLAMQSLLFLRTPRVIRIQHLSLHPLAAWGGGLSTASSCLGCPLAASIPYQHDELTAKS